VAIPSDVLARLPLAPLLVAQALWVRRKALKLPEPPGARAGTTGNGPPLRLLITGDSSAAGVGAPSQTQALCGQLVARLATRHTVTWRLVAKTGATTSSTLRTLAAQPPDRFDLAVVALGVNDVTRATSRRQWVARQTALLDLLVDRFGVTRILVSGLPPMGRFPLLPHPLRWVLSRHADRLDTALADLTARHAVAGHVPAEFPGDPAYVAKDGFHPSPVAYAEWASVLAERIGRP